MPEFDDYDIIFKSKPEVFSNLTVTEAPYGDQIFEIKFENRTDKFNKLSVGIATLERRIQLYDLIMFVFYNLDKDDVATEFNRMIDEAYDINKGKLDIKELRQFLMEQVISKFEFDSLTVGYKVAHDTLSNFEEYFQHMLEKHMSNLN